MKFPTSMHADGWADHFDDAPAAPARTTTNPALKRAVRAGAKPVSAHTPLHLDVSPRTPIPAAPAAAPTHAHAAAPAVCPAVVASPAASPASRSSSVPWVVGAGVGVLLIGGAVVMSRNTTPAEPSAPVVVGQVTPSPEDAQLQAAPSAAGTVAPIAEATPPVEQAPTTRAADEPPAVKPAPVEPTTRTARAPELSAPPVVAAAPAPRVEAPAPVVRTLTPQPEVLAQASPPPVLREAPQSAAPATVPAAPPAALPADMASAPAVPPLAAVPVTPPVVAQQAPAPTPAAPDPVDTGITVQVRQALAADMTLSAVPIAVSTDHGVVKLEGQAPDAQARDRATVVAANTSGVKGVDNRLTLPPVAALDRSTISNGG